jgi:alkyl hydroperoxide reductase subunit F
MYELIIIGGGPAGMTAAVYAARKKINTLLISGDIGGQGLTTWLVENYMGYQFIEGHELMQKFEEQVKQFPTDVKIEVGKRAESLSRMDGGFEVRTDRGETYQAKAVIVATGKGPRKLNVPGEKELLGRGVTYCAICDGPLFADVKSK